MSGNEFLGSTGHMLGIDLGPGKWNRVELPPGYYRRLSAQCLPRAPSSLGIESKVVGGAIVKRRKLCSVQPAQLYVTA